MQIKKTFAILVLSSCFLSTPLLACLNHNDMNFAQYHMNYQQSIIEAAKAATVNVTNTTEESTAFIKNIFNDNGSAGYIKTYIVVDLVTDSLDVNQKIRTFEITEEAYLNCTKDESQDIEGIKKQWKATEYDNIIYRVASKDGRVTKLHIECAE